MWTCVRIDGHVDLCARLCVGMRINMLCHDGTAVCIDVCVDMCFNMCICAVTQQFPRACMRLSERADMCMCRYVYTHVYR